MGSISDLPLDRALVDRVRHAVGDDTEDDGAPRMIPVKPGGPIRP